jgi:hypothetical protein
MAFFMRTNVEFLRPRPVPANDLLGRVDSVGKAFIALIVTAQTL